MHPDRDLLPLLLGVLVSTALAGTFTMAGLEAGITPAVSPLVIVCVWGALAARTTGPDGRRFLTLAQVAGSAGMAVTMGVVFLAPIEQLVHARRGLPATEIDVFTLVVLSLAGALMGFGLVGLATRRFLADPELPAPEARACHELISAASGEAAARPRLMHSLGAGLLLSGLARLLHLTGVARERLTLLSDEGGDGERSLQLDLPFSPIYIGVGGLLSLATALLVFGGTAVRLAGDLLLAGLPPDSALAAELPATSMGWVGGAAMTVCLGASLLRLIGRRRGGASSAAEDAGLLVVDKSMKTFLATSVLGGAGLLFLWLVLTRGAVDELAITMTFAALGVAGVMVVLGALLSLQVGSSASPISATVLVTTLALCLVALALGHDQVTDLRILVPLLVGACVAVCTANDSSQDYKTMQLGGIRVQHGFYAQLLGLIAASIVVPWTLHVAHASSIAQGAGGLADQGAFAVPQARAFATLVEGLLLESELPWYPILAGLGIGLVAVLLELGMRARGKSMPSMALAIGVYLPSALGIGILIGSLSRWLGERGGVQRSESILAAAGLITGAAALDLLLGLAILGGLDVGVLELLDLPNAVSASLGVIGILCLGGLLYANSRRAE